MPAVSAAAGKVLLTGSPVDHGHRLASYDTSLAVSGGVDCGRRRRNVYDRKPQRYAKDNRTAHLTARSDKFVDYVTSSSRMRVIYHNWTAMKQRPHPQSVAEISHHSVLSGGRIRQCETSSGARHKDTDQCL